MLESGLLERVNGAFKAFDSHEVNESPNLSFTLAHLSDVHLPNMRKRAVLSHFEGKRIIGGFSWFLRRRKNHLGEIADAIQRSILTTAPDHVALTGDVVNIAAWNEFPAAADWMRRFGASENLSFVPGNHDAYVKVPWEKGLHYFQPWMTSDRRDPADISRSFPFVRLRRNIALIGLNTGLPQSFRLAAGTLGTQQLQDLAHHLNTLGQQGFYRVVMIHHPPLPGLAIARKALTDAAALQNIMQKEGCELVLHGHNHTATLNWVTGPSGAAPVIGVPSASSSGLGHHTAAAWNAINIKRVQGRWSTSMTPHIWHAETRSVVKGQTTILTPPPGGQEP